MGGNGPDCPCRPTNQSCGSGTCFPGSLGDGTPLWFPGSYLRLESALCDRHTSTATRRWHRIGDRGLIALQSTSESCELPNSIGPTRSGRTFANGATNGLTNLARPIMDCRCCRAFYPMPSIHSARSAPILARASSGFIPPIGRKSFGRMATLSNSRRRVVPKSVGRLILRRIPACVKAI